MRRRIALCLWALGFCTVPLRAGEFPDLSLSVVLDARAGWKDASRSWLDGGLGKTRYGDSGGRDGFLRLSQASLMLGADLSHAFAVRAQLNVDGEPGASGRRGYVDVIEAYGRYRPALSPRFRLEARAGMLFPPVSFEHSGPAWTTIYTITPSAIGSWVGEEVRATGVELRLAYGSEQNEVALAGGAFGWNDPAGSLLAWRGWALHDRQTGRPDRLPIPELPAIGPGHMFKDQPYYASPVQEVDHRAGFYGAATATLAGRLRVQAFHYDNRADETVLRDRQYGWETRFTVLGARLELPGNVELLAQHALVSSVMGRMPDGAAAVGVEPTATYVMATAVLGRHRLTARYDRFEVTQDDVFAELDDNSERGTAWTAAYQLRVAEKHRLALELLTVESTRPARAAMGEAARQRDTLLQASLRIRL